MAASQKISELTTAGPLTGAELVPIVQNGGTLQTTVSVVAAFAVVSLTPAVSALATQVEQVSAAVSVLDREVSLLAAAISAIGDVSALSVLVSTVAVLEADVSALTIRVADVSAVTSVNAAAITSINNAVSTLEIRVSAASAIGVTNASAITSVNNAVSALEIRVSAASATGVTNADAITSVNAVVSIKANRNGDFLTNVQYIDFNTTTSYAPASGRLTWDIESGTLDLGLAGTVNLLVGQRTVAQIFNNSGVTLPKDKAVRVTGSQGQRLTCALAQADSDADSATIFGIMLETVSVNNSGYVATDGLIRNVNTAAYADGDIVYLSPVSAGELTPIKPEAPEHLVLMGYIVKGGSVGAGSLYVKVQNGYELGELHDVKVSASTSLADGEVLAYNVSAQVWTNSPALTIAQASISALNIQLAAVSALASVNAAAVTSINNVVSTLEIRVSAASATGVTNAAAITSINNVVSALEIRVSAVSAQASAIQTQVNAVSVLVSSLDIRLAAVSASVSALQVQVNAVSAAVSSALVSVGQRVLKIGDTMTGPLVITSVSADKAAVSATGFLADSIGNVRTIIQNSRTSAYTLVTSDAGKYISITSGGITVPQNVFLPGDAISIFNNSANNQTVTQGTSVTMYLAGTSLTGNRTLAQRGLSTVLCVTSVVFVISGAGLS